MLLEPSVHVHPTISTQICKKSYLIFKDRDSGTDCWEMLCCGSCSGERTCGCFDPNRIHLKSITELCHGCFYIVSRIHTTKCSSPTCFGQKGKFQYNWCCRKIMVYALVVWQFDWLFYGFLCMRMCLSCLRAGLWFKGICYLVTGANVMPSIRYAALLEIQSRQRQESTTAKRTKVTD